MKPPVPHRRWALAAATALALVVGGLAIPVTRAGRGRTRRRRQLHRPRPRSARCPSGCGAISTNPRQFVTANAPGRRRAHQRLVVVAAVQEDRLRATASRCTPTRSRYDTFARRARLLRTTPRRPSAAPRPASASTTTPTPQDIRVGVAGLNAPDGQGRRLDATGPSRPSWSDGTRTMTATIGHGLPFAYFQITGGNAQITRRRHPDGLVQQRRHDRLHASTATTTSAYAPDRRRPGPCQRHHDHAPRWPARATSPSRVLPTTPAARRRARRPGRHLRPVRPRPRHRHPGLATRYDQATSTVDHDVRASPRPPGRAPAPGRSSRSTRTSGSSLTGATPIAPDLRLAARPDEGRSPASASSRTVDEVPRRAAGGAGGRPTAAAPT